MRSETTAAAEHKGKMIMNDPFAMRPFFGYNFGDYLKHWLSMENRCAEAGGHMPKIFHVNWFRKDANGKFLWPGFGENCRVLEWVLQRVDEHECYEETAIGRIPAKGALNFNNLNCSINEKELFSIPKDFWLKEVEEIKQYYDNQLPHDLPQEIVQELAELKSRVVQM